jgi:surface-anchored protein
VLTTLHVDLDLEFTPPVGTPGPGNLGAWDVGIADETNAIRYATTGAPGATNWAQLFVGFNTLTNRSANPVFNFIGVGPSQPFYYLPQSQIPGRLYLGVGAEDNDPGATNAPITYRLTDPRVNQPTGTDPNANLAPWLRLQLLSMTGPAGGQFSMWNGDASFVAQSNQGVNQVWMATSDGITAADSLFVVNGSHLHLNWAFTEPGVYDLVFQASAFLGGTEIDPQLPTLSDPTVVTFIVQPIPEPASLLLCAAALAGSGWRWRRGQRLSRLRLGWI